MTDLLPADRLSRVVITGGAGGFGRALASQFLARGSRVLVTDVDGDAALRTAGELAGEGEVRGIAHDVRSIADWDRVVAWCDEHWGGADVVVNNAGVAVAGRIEDLGDDDWTWITDINLKGVAYGCRAFTPGFKGQGRGHLVNIASLAAFAAAPTMAPYNATKAAVLSLSETLDAELASAGIRTTVVCPSFFETGIGANSRSSDELKAVTEKLLSSGRLTADQVAAKTVAAVEAGKFLCLPHAESRVVTVGKRLGPWGYRKLLRGIARQVDRRVYANA